MFDILSDKFDSAFKSLRGKARLSEENIEEALAKVRTALLEADVNFKVVRDFIQKVKEQSLGEKVIKGVNPDEQFIKIIHDELCKVMGDANEELDFNRPGPIPVMVVGLNGQGKTTFSGKLALHLKNKKNKKVLLVPCDTFRPAAKEQLQTLARQVEVECFDSNLSLGPVKLAISAMEYARENKFDIVIVDTAGRLHVDNELMEELKQVRGALDSYRPEVLMVADAMTGQEAVNVSKTFHETVKLTGVILSKMDSDAKGGAALSIRFVTGVPIRYISLGEKMKDLELFHPDRLAGRILDMGDVVSLVEKAQDVIDEKDAESMMKNLEKGRFTVDDFMKQMKMMQSLGSMSSIMKMIPGMGGMLRQAGDLAPAEKEMKRMQIIVSSMTKGERQDYKIIKEGRIERIAKGSGNETSQVRDFLNKFRQMEKMMGGFSQMMKGGFPGMPQIPGMPNLGGPQAPKGPKKKGKAWGKNYF